MSDKFVVNFTKESEYYTLGPFENSQLLKVSEELFDRGYSLVDSRTSERRKHSHVYVTNYRPEENITWKTFEEIQIELLSRNGNCDQLDHIIEEAWISKYEVSVNIYSPHLLKKKYLVVGNEFLPKLVCLFDTGCSVSNKLTFNGETILDKSLPSNRKVDVSIRPCLKSALELSPYDKVVRDLLETTFFPSVEINRYALSIMTVPYSKRKYVGPFATIEDAKEGKTLLESCISYYSMEIEELATTCDYPTVDSYLV